MFCQYKIWFFCLTYVYLEIWSLLVISLTDQSELHEKRSRTASNLDGIGRNGEKEMIHAHIFMETSAIVRAIWEDRRRNILHHVFNGMSLLSFTEWQGRGWWRTTAIDKCQTKQKTAERTIDWCVTDYSSHPENYSQADTTSNCWRGKTFLKIHILFDISIQMFFVCLLACFFLFVCLVFLFSFLCF